MPDPSASGSKDVKSAVILNAQPTVAAVARIIESDRVVPKVRSMPLHPDNRDYAGPIVTNRHPAWGPHPTPHDLEVEAINFDIGDVPPAPQPPVTFVSIPSIHVCVEVK